MYTVLIVHRGDTISLYGKTGNSQGSLEGMWKMNWSWIVIYMCIGTVTKYIALLLMVILFRIYSDRWQMLSFGEYS